MAALLIVGLVGGASANPLDSDSNPAQQAGEDVSEGVEQVASAVQDQVNNAQQDANRAATSVREDLLDTAFLVGKNAARLAKHTHKTLVKGAELHSLDPPLRSLSGRVRNQPQVATGLRTLTPAVTRGTGALNSLKTYGRGKLSALHQQHEERMRNRQQGQR